MARVLLAAAFVVALPWCCVAYRGEAHAKTGTDSSMTRGAKLYGGYPGDVKELGPGEYVQFRRLHPPKELAERKEETHDVIQLYEEHHWGWPTKESPEEQLPGSWSDDEKMQSLRESAEEESEAAENTPPTPKGPPENPKLRSHHVTGMFDKGGDDKKTEEKTEQMAKDSVYAAGIAKREKYRKGSFAEGTKPMHDVDEREQPAQKKAAAKSAMVTPEMAQKEVRQAYKKQAEQHPQQKHEAGHVVKVKDHTKKQQKSAISSPGIGDNPDKPFYPGKAAEIYDMDHQVGKNGVFFKAPLMKALKKEEDAAKKKEDDKTDHGTRLTIKNPAKKWDKQEAQNDQKAEKEVTSAEVAAENEKQMTPERAFNKIQKLEARAEAQGRSPNSPDVVLNPNVHTPDGRLSTPGPVG